jgi:hypothetical protein
MATQERQERIARNNAAFRAANERITEVAGELALDGLIPFICECADPTCTRIARLTPSEYNAVRRSSRCYLVLPGHERAERDAARVVETYERYLVVEKVNARGWDGA